VRSAVLSALVLTAALAVASPVAVAQEASGGAQAPETGSAATGGASYGAAVAPEQELAKKNQMSKRKKAAARRRAKARARKLARKRAARRRAARKRKRAARPPAPVVEPTSDHVFPVRGPFSFGGKDSRFGAGRTGHTHQGQDMSAALGTPVVAPWPGIVEVVKYQAGGAGYYVVLDGDGEDRDYVFMHLRKGSTLVVKGQAVAKGQQIAEVGSTGSSSGPHLHFEIWTGGGWYTGGDPVDPLPFLQAWLN
jgi:murein DD-endopeptidase MepM/ murein hydrolase activator NlpD